jgi:hypothetical protein
MSTAPNVMTHGQHASRRIPASMERPYIVMFFPLEPKISLPHPAFHIFSRSKYTKEPSAIQVSLFLPKNRIRYLFILFLEFTNLPSVVFAEPLSYNPLR